MISTRLATLFAALLLVSSVGCQREREQQRHVAQDLLVFADAASKGAEIPPMPDEPGRYGRGEVLVRYMHDRFSRMTADSREFVQLIQKSNTWTNPKAWTSREQIKIFRKEAERATWLIDENLLLIDETSGDRARQAIQGMNLASDFKRGALDGMKENETFRTTTCEMLGTLRLWTKNTSDLLALIDEKADKLDAGNPKFFSPDDVENYHRLTRKGNEYKILLSQQLPRFQNLYKDAQTKMKDLRDTSKSVLGD